VRFGLEDITCVTEPPSEKAVINAACVEKLESVTVAEGANAFPLFVCVPPHMQLTYYNIFPDVFAAAANLVDVPITSTGALDAAQIEEEIPALDFSSDSESDSERGQTCPGTSTFALLLFLLSSDLPVGY